MLREILRRLVATIPVMGVVAIAVFALLHVTPGDPAVIIAGDYATAEDIAQASLVQAMRRLETWRGEAALFTWLCAICRRELMAWWTRTGRQPPRRSIEDDVEVRAALERIAASDDDPEWLLERSETAQLVQATLDRLPGHYGDVLEWKYIQGHAVSDIAARLGSTPKAVESMLTRARQAFREGFAALTRSSEAI